MDANEEVERLLAEHGAKLIRGKKHRVYAFPDGRVFVRPSSCSDHRGADNALAFLRRFLGLKRESGKNPERRPKQGVGKIIRYEPIPLREDWKEKLKGMAK